MTIDWTSFTPWRSLAGGVLIGVAVTLFILLNGRIAGVSGVVGGLLNGKKGDIGWRLAFIAGLAGAPLIYALFATVPTPRIDAGMTLVGFAGLLVGLGTRYGSGCTSGHGVCGISRGSRRSVVATLAFMCAGFATVFVLRHLAGV